MKTQLLRLTAGLLAYSLLLTSCGHKKNRTIEVIGSAEKEVTSDEVYYSVTLTEYTRDKDKTEVTIPELQTALVKRAEGAGIKKEDIRVDNMYIYSYYFDYYRNHHNKNFVANKTFEIKVDKPETIEKLLGGDDSLNCTAASIKRFDNSNKKVYRDALKIQALKAAYEKAERLLKSIGEELGSVISITEIEAPQENDPYAYPYGGGALDNNITQQSIQEKVAGFKDMKLSYRMKVVFEIK